MKNHQILTGLIVVALAICWTGGSVQAQVAGNNPIITVDENGNGSLVFPPGGGTFALPGVLASDPGPGGLASALTYNLLGPPGLVAGDVILLEPGSANGALSDLIRFNPFGAGGVASYPASFVFYSDRDDASDSLADVGFPTGRYTNVLTLTEVGPEAGPNGFFGYTPTANQPGFIPGFNVTYNFISDPGTVATPEPTTLATAGLGLIAAGIVAWRRRSRAISPA